MNNNELINQSKTLPLGTVVSIKYNYEKLMVVGYQAIPKDSNDKVYDYIGCYYPNGISNTDKLIVFDHNQITKIYSLGYIENNENEFNDDIKKY